MLQPWTDHVSAMTATGACAYSLSPHRTPAAFPVAATLRSGAFWLAVPAGSTLRSSRKSLILNGVGR